MMMTKTAPFQPRLATSKKSSGPPFASPPSLTGSPTNPATSGLRIGLFGGRTGAAAAMIAAALRPAQVHAVISRGGRPDLADELLMEVKAPTLMIVGSNDHTHIDHNRKAGEKMLGTSMLEVVIGASHLFGEPGKIEQVASISYQWFQRNLALCG